MRVIETVQLSVDKGKSELLRIAWMQEPKEAGYLHYIYKKNYLYCKRYVIKALGLKAEHCQHTRGMFHSYVMYMVGETLFIYDCISYNTA